MKKTILSMLLAVVAVVLVSCNKASSFEKQAKKQMEITLKEMAKNPETFQINNVETKFCNDSTCVLHVKTKGQNGFGGWSTSNLEYIYVKSSCNTYECVTDLEEEKTVYNMVKDLYEEYRKPENNGLLKMKMLNGKGWENETKESRANMIHSACVLTAAFSGRKIDKENKNDDWLSPSQQVTAPAETE